MTKKFGQSQAVRYDRLTVFLMHLSHNITIIFDDKMKH